MASSKQHDICSMVPLQSMYALLSYYNVSKIVRVDRLFAKYHIVFRLFVVVLHSICSAQAVMHAKYKEVIKTIWSYEIKPTYTCINTIHNIEIQMGIRPHA
jgi:hypothetical protein